MKWTKLFIASAGSILLAAALIRFIIAAGNAQIMTLPEPMLGIPLRLAVLMVGGIELAVALICLFGKQIRVQAGLVAWLSTNFIVFWIGLVWMNYHLQATCIGSLTDPLHFSGGMIGFAIQLLPFGLLAGSYVALLQPWFAGKFKSNQILPERKDTQAMGAGVLVRFLKISCPACHEHVEFPTNRLGEKIPCPHCQAPIILQKARNLKMACPACGGHVEFPVDAVGEKLPCPHCAKTITLCDSDSQPSKI